MKHIAEDINALFVCRIDSDLAEIKRRSRIERAHPSPRFSFIIGTKNTATFAVRVVDIACSAFITLNDRVDNI